MHGETVKFERRKNSQSDHNTSKTLSPTKKKKVFVCMCECVCARACEHARACVKSGLTLYFSFCNTGWYRWCLNKIHSKSEL